MYLENLDEVLEHLNQPFGFLLDKGYKVFCSDFPGHFDNFAVGLEIPDFRIRFNRDRSAISAYVGPHEAKGCWSMDLWYDLSIIIMYLTHNKVLISGYWWEYRHDADQQLEQIAKSFYHFFDEIVELYKPENLSKNKDNLDLVIKEVLILDELRNRAERIDLEKRGLEYLKSIKLE
jgi:hypothetical protein